MSGKKKKDYRKVLKAVLHLPPVQPALAKVTIDFEKAIWTVLRELLPDVEVQGCVFHWTQALWRKVQELGLQPNYMNDRGTYSFIRKVMALPFLPATEIPAMYAQLQANASTPRLQQFMEYVETT